METWLSLRKKKKIGKFESTLISQEKNIYIHVADTVKRINFLHRLLSIGKLNKGERVSFLASFTYFWTSRGRRDLYFYEHIWSTIWITAHFVSLFHLILSPCYTTIHRPTQYGNSEWITILYQRNEDGINKRE